MAQEAHEAETDAAAKKAAGEKAQELEARLRELNDERNGLKLKLKMEIEKAAKENAATDSQLAKLQNDQKAAMKKFKEEHDKLEEVGEKKRIFCLF